MVGRVPSSSLCRGRKFTTWSSIPVMGGSGILGPWQGDKLMGPELGAPGDVPGLQPGLQVLVPAGCAAGAGGAVGRGGGAGSQQLGVTVVQACVSARAGEGEPSCGVQLWAVAGAAPVPAPALMCALCCVVLVWFFFLLTFSFSFPPPPLPACPPCLYCMRQSVSWWGGWVPPPFPCLCQPHVLGRKSPVWINSFWSNPHLCNPVAFLRGW